MKQFLVKLSQIVREKTEVVVSAENEDEAKEKAIVIARDADDWKFDEDYDRIQVRDVKKLPVAP